MIDFHSHVLPGIDDGSSCEEESLDMLRIAKSQGVITMLATPHFYAQNHTMPFLKYPSLTPIHSAVSACSHTPAASSRYDKQADSKPAP